MKKFTIQIRASVVLSREIRAESLNEALDTAKAHAACNTSQHFVRPRAGWSVEWDEENEVTAVIA